MQWICLILLFLIPQVQAGETEFTTRMHQPLTTMNPHPHGISVAGPKRDSWQTSNVRYYSFQMNQLWFYSEKQRDRIRFDIGGRMDFNYGIDSFWATGLDEGWGQGDYCVSLPQMYTEVGKGDFSLRVGKIFTEMGLDSSYATERFFTGHRMNVGPVPTTVPSSGGGTSTRNSAFSVAGRTANHSFSPTSTTTRISAA